VTGPEGLEDSGNGLAFWSGYASGTAAGGNYAHWSTGEPNNHGGTEYFAHIFGPGSSDAGYWNDFAPNNSNARGYIVEYGGMPDDNPLNVVSTKTVSIANGYTVAFNSQGGSAVNSVTEVVYGLTITAPTDPTRSGYTFSGWYKEAGCINSWSFSADTVTGNITLYAKWTNSTGDGDSTSATTTPANTGVDILVNGKTEKAGTATTTTEGNQTVTTVTVDHQKLEQKLAAEGNNAVVTIYVNTNADIVIGELNGQMIKNMEVKEAVLEVKTGNATYTLPAKEININSISQQLGSQVELKDIKVQIEIAKPAAEALKLVESSAKNGEFTVVAAPVEFNVKCTYGNKTVKVKNFDAYVERMISIPDGVDPSKVTTGIIIDPDGTVRHVPTRVTVINGKYYAVINSLTNSLYSVIWHPLQFKDAEKHWAKEAINDMGSRMVISGVGNDMFEPDRDITRAEFAAIIVRALGLKPGTGSNPFTDVSDTAWYCEYIKTASSFKIIEGYGAGKFGPMDKITREQAMTMIAKAMRITGSKVEFEKDEIEKLLAGFGDSNESAAYAKSNIAACIKTGIISGRDGNMIAPKDNITRAEVAVIVRRLLQKSNLI